MSRRGRIQRSRETSYPYTAGVFSPSGFAPPYPLVSWFTIPTTDGVNNYTFYVDSSRPDDSGNGLSPATAKKTVAAGWALVGSNQGSGANNNRGDQLLFKCGSTWTDERIGRLYDGGNTKNGASWARPLVLGSYGSGARPQFNYSAGTDGLFGTDPSETNNYIVVDDISCTGTQPQVGSPVGLSFLGIANHILIQNCSVTAFGANYRQQGDDPHRHTDITIRGCCFADSNALLSVGTNASQGAYFQNCDGLTIEFCTIDNNGFRDASDYTQYRHNLYVQDGCTGVVYQNNICANNDGVQLKAGGTCTGNVFSRLIVALKDGYGDTPPPAGVTTTVTDCAFLELLDPPVNSTPDGHVFNAGPPPPPPGNDTPLRVGYALYLGNIVSGTFARLYFVGGTGTDGRMMWWRDCNDGTFHRAVQNTTFDSMISHNTGGMYFELTADHTYSTNNKVTNCVFQSPNNATFRPDLAPHNFIIDTFPGYTNDDLALTNCKFSPNAVTNLAFAANNATTLGQWFTDMGAVGCSVALTTYSDPDRSLATYGPTVGLGATHSAVMTAARTNRRGPTNAPSTNTWDQRYTGPAIVAYVKAGLT